MAVNFAQWGNSLYTGKRSYDIVGHRRIFFTASGIVILICIISFFFPGLTLGIDFTGGSQFQITTASTPTDQNLDLARATVQATIGEREPTVTKIGTSQIRVETKELSSEQSSEVRTALAKAFKITADKVTATYIGPTWGKDVSGKAFRGAIIFLVLVGVGMSLYFRAWRMAVSALVALLHDMIITLGIYAIVGFEITPASVIGFLTVLAYSLYDTVVIFDKVRENTTGIVDQTQYTYAEAANLAVNQTLVRSINTSVIALLPVASILFIGSFILGAGTLSDISLALFVGMIAGAYSSIFIATPMETLLRSRETRIKEHDKLVFARRDQEGTDATKLTHLTPIGAVRPGQHQGVAAQPKRPARAHRGASPLADPNTADPNNPTGAQL